MAVSVDISRSGRHHPFCLFLVLGGVVFVCLFVCFVGWLVSFQGRRKQKEDCLCPSPGLIQHSGSSLRVCLPQT